MRHRDILDIVFDPENHSDKCREKYAENGYFPRFGGYDTSTGIENLEVTLMFEQSNYRNKYEEYSWKEVWEESRYEEAVDQYYESMCFSWFDNKTRKPVIDTILETLDIEQEALYLTDHRKCYDGCKADYFTEKELPFIQENTDLIITFGKKAKKFFQDKPSTCITGDVLLTDNIREVHGHLFLLEDLGVYLMPLLFINIAQQAAPRSSYYNYMGEGIKTFKRQE